MRNQLFLCSLVLATASAAGCDESFDGNSTGAQESGADLDTTDKTPIVPEHRSATAQRGFGDFCVVNFDQRSTRHWSLSLTVGGTQRTFSSHKSTDEEARDDIAEKASWNGTFPFGNVRIHKVGETTLVVQTDAHQLSACADASPSGTAKLGTRLYQNYVDLYVMDIDADGPHEYEHDTGAESTSQGYNKFWMSEASGQNDIKPSQRITDRQVCVEVYHNGTVFGPNYWDGVGETALASTHIRHSWTCGDHDPWMVVNCSSFQGGTRGCSAGKVPDCAGNCVDSGTAVRWTGDGYCDDGSYGVDLMCGNFQFDDQDCADKACDPGKVYDCAGNCVDEATALSWLGDGYCDSGSFNMDLACDAFQNDGGDCN